MYVASYVLKAKKGMSEILKQAVKEILQESVRIQLKKLGSAFLTNREVSAQEAVYRVLSMPLRMCSRKVIFVNTDTPERRIGLLLPDNLQQERDADDDDIRYKNMIDCYSARPPTLEDLCLADFVSVYTYGTRKADGVAKNEDSSDKADGDKEPDETSQDDQFDTQALPLVITLQGGMGKLKRRRVPAVLRWLSFNVHKDPDKYYRSQLMLFVPWRNEENLSGDHDSFETQYTAEKEEILQRAAR